MFRALVLLCLVSNAWGAQPSADYVRRHARSVPAAISTLARYKVISVGEIHGTRQGPAFVLEVLRLLRRTGKSVLLGLEIPASEQNSVDSYLRTGRLSFLRKSEFFRREYQDGRSSRAMYELLRGVRSLPKVKVFGFDAVNVTSGQDRDEKMARNLAAAYRAAKPDVLVFLAGNIHASISVGTPFDSSYRPMGYQMLGEPDGIFAEKDFLPIKIRSRLGDAWVCFTASASECGTHPMKFGPSVYSEALPWNRYFLPEVNLFEGYRATYFVRSLSASPPLVSAP